MRLRALAKINLGLDFSYRIECTKRNTIYKSRRRSHEIKSVGKNQSWFRCSA